MSDRRGVARTGPCIAWFAAIVLGATDLAADDDPIAVEREVGRGIAAFEKGRHDEALAALRKAEPTRAGPAYYRGLSLLALDRAREAIAEFEAVRKDADSPSEVELDRGVAQLAAGQSKEAEATLTPYVAAHPGDPYGHYFLGVALFRQRRDDEALIQFEMASSDAALAPYLDFYQGVAAYGRGDPEFRRRLNQYRAASPTGPAAELSGRLCASNVGDAPVSTPEGWGRPVDTDETADRRWNLAVLSGYEYDTNVALSPSIPLGGLGGGLDRRDSRWLVASFGEYRFIQRDDLVFGVIGSTYDTFQFEQDDLNVQDYMAGAYVNAALTSRLLAGTRYEFHETLLDGRQFTTDHRLVPNLTLLEGTFGHLTTYYEFNALDVEGFALVPAQRRTGDVHSVGVTQAFYLFEGAGRLYLGYRHEDAATDGSDFDRRTNMVTARVEAPLPWQSVANLEVRQFWDDYGNPNSLDAFGRPRSDRRVEVRAGLQKFLTPHVSMRLDYSYTINDSNVENLFGASFYSYDRHVISTLFIYDF